MFSIILGLNDRRDKQKEEEWVVFLRDISNQKKVPFQMGLNKG